MTDTKRTLSQNKSLHLMFEQLANELNDNGLDVRSTLKEDIEIPWNAYLIKELIWKKVQKAQLGKESTTQLTTKEINQVFEVIARHLAQKFGIVIEFPSIETLMMKERTK
jgi:hypothetical protein